MALELATVLGRALGQAPGEGDIDLRRTAADSVVTIAARRPNDVLYRALSERLALPPS